MSDFCDFIKGKNPAVITSPYQTGAAFYLNIDSLTDIKQTYAIPKNFAMANVKDITSIPEENKRMRAERIIIVLAKDCIKNRARFKCGSDYVTAIEAAIKKIDREV